MEDLDRITQNPAVMGGKACIRGLRVTVGMVVGQLAAGQSIDALRTDYPYLEPADENPDRYESFAAMAEVSDRSGPASGPLV